MAILSPNQIHAVLKEESRNSASRNLKPEAQRLADLLAKHNLTPDDALERLNSEMNFGDSAATRLRATETALKLNGLLDSDNNKPDFNVVINIMDSEFSGINPILIPRSTT